MTDPHNDAESVLFQAARPLPPFELQEDFPAPTSLEASESREHRQYEYTDTLCGPAKDRACAFRHSGWTPYRALIRDALKRCGFDQTYLIRWDCCGEHVSVYQDAENPDRLQLRGSYCRSRWCQPCAVQRSRVIANNLHAAIDNRPCRFMTLTLRHTDDSLGDQVDRLYDAFRRLRRRRLWLRNVDAGAWFLELAYNRERDEWHPHLHVIVQGRFIRHDDLRSAWLACTGDSPICDIRMVRDPDQAARYVAKYASKPFNVKFVRYEDRLDEALLALRSRRLCGTFGDWRHVHLNEVPRDDTDWVYVGRLGVIIWRAEHGSEHAVGILSSLDACYPNPITIEWEGFP